MFSVVKILYCNLLTLLLNEPFSIFCLLIPTSTLYYKLTNTVIHNIMADATPRIHSFIHCIFTKESAVLATGLLYWAGASTLAYWPHASLTLHWSSV